MRALVVLVAVSFAWDVCGAKDTQTVIIETKYGKVEGDVIEVPEEDFLVNAFKGIPYGSARRFQKPEPAKPWTYTLSARKWGKRCPQHQVFGKLEPILAEDVSEDCLVLNVFAPSKKADTPYPVMVFIHGGGFADGSSTEYGQDGIVHWMVPKGIVVVTINYRLGPWGFFSTGSADAPGNYGLWDQTLALKWVQENIANFGGNPKKVTLFGESAGAISVALLGLSPHSRDLFQQTIAMSGSSYLPWFSPDTALTLQAGQIISTALECGSLQTNKASVIISCLSGKSTEELLAALYTYNHVGNYEYVGFVPVYDNDFFPEPIPKLQATAPTKPLISGTTTDEIGLLTVTPLPFDHGWLIRNPEAFTIDHLVEKLPYYFPEDKYGKLTSLVRDLALHHYVDSRGDRRNNSFVLHQYKQIFSDFLFGYPAYKEALERHSKGSKVWLYSFDYYDDAIFPKDFKYKGAQHFLELPYLFKMLPMTHPTPFEGDDKKVKDVMTTLWTNFAKYGHPNPEQSPYNKAFSWEPISDQHPDRYLHIGPDPEQRELYNRQMVSFWNELLPKLSKLTMTKGDHVSAVKTEL